MMLDADIVAASPGTVYRVLKGETVGQRKNLLKVPVLLGPPRPMNIGILISLISIFGGRSITCAAFWMATVVLLFIGRSEKR